MAALDEISSSPTPVVDVCNGESSSSTTMSCSEFYTKRVCYLEQFRERVELCKFFAASKRKYGGSLSSVDSNGFDYDLNSNMTRLGQDMVSLLEKDVQLTEQLITLSNTLEQLKACFAKKKSDLSKTPISSSCSSLNSAGRVDCFDGEDDDTAKIKTVISVNEEDHGFHENAPTTTTQQHQFFSRKDSALRIPIKRNSQKRPRLPTVEITTTNSARSTSRANVANKRIVERASCPQFESEYRSNLHSPNSDSGMSSSSLSGVTYNKGGVNVVTTLSGKNSVIVHHGSQNSFDSGVHSASPEEREEIFV